jgi:phosphatidylglycerophosphate synthase
VRFPKIAYKFLKLCNENNALKTGRSVMAPHEPANESIYDGFVSRHLNRTFSKPLARLLCHTPVTPNQVSVASLGVALASFLCFVSHSPIAGGLLAQMASILDGVDGDLARLKNMTSAFGGFMDAILDRYADAVIYLGLIIWTAGDSNPVEVWITGFWALVGTFVVTYTRARIEQAPRDLFDRGLASVASRDIRLFVVMIGALAGEGFVTLVVLAGLTNGVGVLRLMYARRILKGR